MRLDHDVEPDERDVALRADNAAGRDAAPDIDDLGIFDHIIARTNGRGIRVGQRAPGSLDRDRADRQIRRVRLIRQVAALAPAAGGDRVIFGFVDPDLVARIGAVLRDERIEKLAQREAGLVEIRIGNEGGQRFFAIVDAGAARVAAVIARPWGGGDSLAVGPDLEQLITGLERFPDPRPGIAGRLRAIRLTAMSRV